MASPFAKTVHAESTGLAIPEIPSVPDYFKPGGTQEFIQSVAAHCNAQKFTIDTDEGRDGIRSLAYKVVKTKTALIKKADEWAKAERETIKSVKTEVEHFASEMDNISNTARKPLTDWEDFHEKRLGAHETALGQVFNACLFVGAPTIEAIQKRLAQIGIIETRAWEEFRDRASEGIAQARVSLGAMLEKAEKAEADRIEADTNKIRIKELEDREAERQKKDENDRIAKEAADKAAKEAEREKEAPVSKLWLPDSARRAISEQIAQTAPFIPAREPIKPAVPIYDPEPQPAEVTPAQFTAVSMMPLLTETPEENAVDHMSPSVDDLIIDAFAEHCDLDFDEAADVFNAIKGGKIPHVQIVY